MSEYIDSISEEIEESDFYEHYRLLVDKGQGLLRVDKFLMGRIENATRNRIQVAIHAGNVLVNGKNVKPNYLVKPLDTITIVLAHPLREFELVAENIPLNIVYEDDDVLVINKEPGMVVHPGHGNYTGTLMNALLYYLENANASATASYPYLVHRIDKDTSGILLIAKNELAQSRLALEFFNHTIERKYVGLVWGDVKTNEGTVEGHVGRSPKDRRVMSVYRDGQTGKPAITHYKVMQRFGYVTLLEFQLETGRTHQIRAHMKHLGHPLFNDEKYGGNMILKGTTFTKYKQFIQNCFTLIPRQALHAKSLGFAHPLSGEKLFFNSSLPDDMQAVIDKWERYVSAHQVEE
ncbi:MAG: RluA family pseudouridine synthase [Bacteroidales bacterium]|nr:RluA family pseudouridine synthase [Bacteroidales bacterium]MDZ4203386.1 RluA family pseudouridine synthase [Bacteroidales bacterium]